MVVEELLEFFVGVVYAELLEAVLLEDLETGNVEDSDPVRRTPRPTPINSLKKIIESRYMIFQIFVYLVDTVDEAGKETLVEGATKGFN